MADRFLTPLQRRAIAHAIRDGHLAYIAEMFGPTAIDHDDFVRLRTSGKIRDEKLMPQDIAAAVHAFGAALTGDDTSKALSPDFFWKALKDPQVISEAEREAISILRDRMGQHVRGLGSRLDSITGHILVDVDDNLRRRRLTKIQREVSHGVETRAAAQEVAARLRDSMKELKRDWMRTAHTEMHNAKEEAKAIVLAHNSPDRDPRVFKRPRPDACRFCVMLYLRPDKITPRVFKLSELLANSTNVGRKAGQPSRSGTQWKAVIGAMHPFCFPAGSSVMTARGPIPIERVRRGDAVWTHAGRWRPVMQVSERSYTDDLVVVSWSGGEVSATKEHPFLTERGWVSAENLRETDRALEARTSEITFPEVDHKPTFAREREELQGILALLLRAEVPVATVDLYRELCLWYGDVDAVDANSMDRRYFDARFAERFDELALQLGEFLVSLHSTRAVKFLGDGLWSSTHSFVRCLREALTFFTCELAHAKALRFAGVPDLDSSLLQPGNHSASGCSQLFSNSQHGQLSLVKREDLLDGDAGARHLAMATRFSTYVNVKSERRPFAGSVYNLHVDEDESFVCNGLIVHNCQCELRVLPEGRGFDSNGQMIYTGLNKSVPIEMLDKALASHDCEEP